MRIQFILSTAGCFFFSTLCIFDFVATGFVLNKHSRHARNLPLLYAKRKLSFKEKKRRRARNQAQAAAAPRSPIPRFDAGSKDVIDAVIEDHRKIEHEEAPKSKDAIATETRAKELVDSQRDSVGALTHFRKRVEAIPVEEMRKHLEEKGYFVHDGFLDSADVITAMQEEADALRPSMELHMDQIGAGEYSISLKGGEEQYELAPRCIEFIVSVTKHVAPLFEKVDPSSCVSVMTTFDRKAQQASLKLLTGEESIDILYPESKPFSPLVEPRNKEEKDSKVDTREITFLYYIVAENWCETSAGGGITVKEGSDEIYIPPKHDRLVILKSKECMLRNEVWKGTENLESASYIELSLLKQL